MVPKTPQCPATTVLTLPCMEGFEVHCERPASRHGDHWITVLCLDKGHSPHYTRWMHGTDLCRWCGKKPDEIRHAVRCPDAFGGTSFADAVEAALFQALCMFTVAMEGRDHERGRHSDSSDINIEYRRLIRDLVEGKRDPYEFLESI